MPAADLRELVRRSGLSPVATRVRRVQRQAAARRRERRIVHGWLRAGRPVPPPEPVKWRLVRATAVARGLHVFVETGTFRGDMVEAMRTHCTRIISIELDPARFEAASARFAGCTNVTILHGDSGKVLSDVVAELTEPALFWLDGHYSGPGTARGEADTPILAELSHVLDAAAGHTILVDDARLFDGTADYPTLAELERHVRRLRSDASIDIRDDMIEVGRSR